MNILNKINEYLGLGGLFNPELMEHEKVRDMIIECQDEINNLQEELKRTKESLFNYKRANDEIRLELDNERNTVNEYASEGFWFSISNNYSAYPIPRRDDWSERFSDRVGLIKYAGKLARETQSKRRIEL